MATGMLGANTDELRALAGVYAQRAQSVRDAETTTAPEVEGVRWQGTDADVFRQRYAGEVVPDIARLAELLEHVKSELERQAEEQDTCSEGNGGQGQGQGQGQGTGQSWLDRLGGFYNGIFKPLGKLVKGLRWGMELATLIRNPAFARDFFEAGASWRNLTGWQLNSTFDEAGKVLGKYGDNLEDIAKGSKGLMAKGFKNMPGYNAVAWMTDRFNHKWVSESLEKLLPASVRDGLTDVTGKSGRALGKVLGAFSVGMDAGEAMNAFRAGNVWSGKDGSFTSGGAWNTAQAVAGSFSFVPGPVGWVATGVSLGMAGTELVVQNWDTIKNAGSVVVDTVGDVANSIKDGASEVISMLNPFD